MDKALSVLNTEIYQQQYVYSLRYAANEHGWCMAALAYAMGILTMTVLVAAWRYL